MNWSNIKEITETLKNISTLIFYLIVISFFAFAVWPRVKNFEIKKVSVAGVELGPIEKAALKTIESIPNNLVKQGKDTVKISEKIIDAAKIAEPIINSDNKTWIYIGQIINGKLMNTHFKIKDIPKSGEKIIALDAVYKRKNCPIKTINGDWKLGEIRGVVMDNESVTIDKVMETEDKNYWASIH